MMKTCCLQICVKTLLSCWRISLTTLQHFEPSTLPDSPSFSLEPQTVLCTAGRDHVFFLLTGLSLLNTDLTPISSLGVHMEKENNDIAGIKTCVLMVMNKFNQAKSENKDSLMNIINLHKEELKALD